MNRIVKVGDFTFTFTSNYRGNAKWRHIYITPDWGVYCTGTDCASDQCPFSKSQISCEVQAEQLFKRYSRISQTKAIPCSA